MEYLHGLHFIILINCNHLLKPITNLTKSPVLSKYCFFFSLRLALALSHYILLMFFNICQWHMLHISYYIGCAMWICSTLEVMFLKWFFYQYSITLHSVLVPVMNPLLFSFQGHLSCELRLWAYNHLHFLTVFKDSLYIQETFGWTAGPYQDP